MSSPESWNYYRPEPPKKPHEKITIGGLFGLVTQRIIPATVVVGLIIANLPAFETFASNKWNAVHGGKGIFPALIQDAVCQTPLKKILGDSCKAVSADVASRLNELSRP